MQEGPVPLIPRTHTYLGIGSEVIQRGDVQPELAGLRELPEAGSQRHQFVPRDIGGQLEDLLAARRWGKKQMRETELGPQDAGTSRARPPASPHVVHAFVV